MNKKSVIIKKITTIAILSALGTILMVFLNFPYIPVPFLKFDFSDTVVLVGYALTGVWGALSISIIKALIDILVLGPVGPFAVGQIIAILASLSFTLMLFVCDKLFRLMKNKIGSRLIGYVIIVISFTLIMTISNLLFTTPMYLGLTWIGEIPDLNNFVLGPFSGNYAVVIMAVYIPFNLLKGLLIVSTYEILFNRVIHKYVKGYLNS